MDNREGLDNHDNSLFFEDADVEFSQESLESLADDYASRGALDYKFIIQVIPVSFQVLSN